mgnify:CR=1 FL=1
MSPESEIWPSVLEILRGELRDTTFNLWFGDLVLQKLVDDKAYLQTPNLFKKKTIETKFMDQLKSAFENVMGFEIIPYVISTESESFETQYFNLIEKEAQEKGRT